MEKETINELKKLLKVLNKNLIHYSELCSGSQYSEGYNQGLYHTIDYIEKRIKKLTKQANTKSL
jgi:hypothetical protein